MDVRLRGEIGPLRPTPAHFQFSFHDGMDVRLRGEIGPRTPSPRVMKLGGLIQ
jgi:hypothetical protein